MAAAAERAAAEIRAGAAEVSLRRAGVDAEGLAAVADALRRTRSLARLDLGDNPGIGDAGCALLAEAIRVNSSLTDLDLSNTGVTGNGIRQLTKKFKEAHDSRAQFHVKVCVTRLNLAFNRYGALGPTAMYKALSLGSTLRDICLSGLNAEGATRLAEAICQGATPLERLRLLACQVDLGFGAAVATILACNTLTGLQIGDAVPADALQAMLAPLAAREAMLSGLAVANSHLDHSSLFVLRDLVARNSSLVTLSLPGCSVPPGASLDQFILPGLDVNLACRLARVDGVVIGPELDVALQRNFLRAQQPRSFTPSVFPANTRLPTYGMMSETREASTASLGSGELFFSGGRAVVAKSADNTSQSPDNHSTKSLAVGSFDATARRFVSVPGKLKEMAFIAANPFRSELAVATQAQNSYNQVLMHSIPDGELVSVARLGRKVGAIAFDPSNGNLIVATASGQSQLLSYEYQKSDNTWVLVWKKSIQGYGPYVRSITMHGCGAFFKIRAPPADVAVLPSNYVVFDLETEALHCLACDGTMFPRCSDLMIYPERSALMILQPSDTKSSQTGLLHAHEVIDKREDRFCIPEKTPMALGETDAISPKNSLIVSTPEDLMLLLSWESRPDGVLSHFKVTYLALEPRPCAAQRPLEAYCTKHASQLTTIRKVCTTELHGMPDISQVQSATYGKDNLLHLLCVERVKMPKKKWFLFKRYVFTFQGWHRSELAAPAAAAPLSHTVHGY